MLDRTPPELAEKPIPAYMRDVYTWAYLTPWLAELLDRQIVVQTILWGNAQKLIADVVAQIKPGDMIYQPAAVYGSLSRQLAERVGPSGRLEVRDISPLQVARTRIKLAGIPQANVERGDAAEPAPEPDQFDAVTCFFLLHEVPDDVKLQVVPAMLSLVKPGGQAIFVDYHGPGRFHPLKPLMRFVYWWLEPYALAMWSKEIEQMAGPRGKSFRWRKTTRFGGLYQMVIAERAA